MERRNNALAIELEPLAQAPLSEPTDDELAAFYLASAPPNAPPLATLREHVVAAFQRSTPRASARDIVAERGAAIDCQLLFTQAQDFNHLALPEGARPCDFVHPQRWFDATAGMAAMRLIAERVTRGGQEIILAHRGEWLDTTLFWHLSKRLSEHHPGWGFYLLNPDRGDDQATVLCSNREGVLRLRAFGVDIR